MATHANDYSDSLIFQKRQQLVGVDTLCFMSTMANGNRFDL